MSGCTTALKRRHGKKSELGCLLDKFFEWGDYTNQIVHELLQKDPDKELLRKVIPKWVGIMRGSFGAKKQGVYEQKTPQHGIKCCMWGGMGTYEHFVEAHALDLLDEHGNLIKFSNWFLESAHKYVKENLKEHCNWGGGNGAGFNEKEPQTLRRTNHGFAYARESMLKRRA